MPVVPSNSEAAPRCSHGSWLCVPILDFPVSNGPRCSRWARRFWPSGRRHGESAIGMSGFASAVEGSAADSAPTAEGDDRHREVRGRDRQLPRRVRDEPIEGDPIGRDPSSRSTSRIAAGRPTPARSGRSTRASSSISRAAASRPTRRASSSSSASSSRSSRACRWPMRRTACATCSREMGAGRQRSTPAPTRRRVRRIDLLGVERSPTGR